MSTLYTQTKHLVCWRTRLATNEVRVLMMVSGFGSGDSEIPYADSHAHILVDWLIAKALFNAIGQLIMQLMNRCSSLIENVINYECNP